MCSRAGGPSSNRQSSTTQKSVFQNTRPPYVNSLTIFPPSPPISQAFLCGCTVAARAERECGEARVMIWRLVILRSSDGVHLPQAVGEVKSRSGDQICPIYGDITRQAVCRNVTCWSEVRLCPPFFVAWRGRTWRNTRPMIGWREYLLFIFDGSRTTDPTRLMTRKPHVWNSLVDLSWWTRRHRGRTRYAQWHVNVSRSQTHLLIQMKLLPPSSHDDVHSQGQEFLQRSDWLGSMWSRPFIYSTENVRTSICDVLLNVQLLCYVNVITSLCYST
jgi:hypothetical protein